MEMRDHPLMGVRQRRSLLGIPAGFVAARLGITVTTYNRFERGERRAYFDQAIVIAKALGCTLDQLQRPLTPDEELELFRQSQIVRSKKAHADQIAQEHRAAEEVQHDLADHGFVTPVTEENTPGTVVDAAHTQPAANTDGDDDATQMLADWGYGEDDDSE